MTPPRHRVDALFVLPRIPATAALLGELPLWADDLRERRIELVAADERPDVLVAEPAPAQEAAGLVDPQWVLLVSSGSIVRRDAFLLFPRGESSPAQVVKFSRVPGAAQQFERDERAARLIATTGGEVARRAPSLLARFEVGGRSASLETAAAGTKLTNLLREPRRRRGKLSGGEAGGGRGFRGAPPETPPPPAP